MRVLLAVDGSPAAGVARRLVESLPWGAGDTIRIVTAFTDALAFYGPHWAVMTITDLTPLDQELRAASQAIVDDAAATTRATVNATVEADVIDGRPGSAIVEDAAAFRADLVVVGSRGHGAFQTALLGSVSAEVVDHAPCPVLVARRGSVDRVVVGDDGSAEAAHARSVVAAPPFNRFPMRVVSVAAVPLPWEGAVSPLATPLAMGALDESIKAHRAEHQRLAEAGAAVLAEAGVTVDTEVRLGGPAAELVAAATEWDAGLIAMGTHGQGGMRRLLLGSVARSVLHHAPCSVLIARGAAGGVSAA